MTDALRSRLASLVRDAGRTIAAPVAKATDEMANALATLRAAQQRRDRHRREAERALPGELVAPGVRRIRWAEAFEGNDASDLGRFALTSGVAETIAAHAARTGRLDAPPWEPPGRHDGELVFIDTETTGLAGGTGTLVFLLGLARVRRTHIEVDQWLLSSPGGEHEWLDAIAASLPPDPLLVSFNGKAFDIPLLAARHRLKRRRDPFANRTHWDLLFPLRRAFDSRWPDCRLQTAERRLLGHARVDDLPGSFAPAAYPAWLRQGDATLLNQVITHNRHDVVSLARLLPALVRVFERPADFDADAHAIG
ncbi:MAG TPA: ribonuclease H-like domain-containing protein, partial [Xanthomonadales bacterium]|nr:ribonuclease H-like domain-containing protein [Xanthomonadales bacterium]